MILVDINEISYSSFLFKNIIFKNIALSFFKKYNKLAIFGVNGIGKSTIVNALFSSNNTILIDGNITFKSNKKWFTKEQFLLVKKINFIEAELGYPDISLKSLIEMNKLVYNFNESTFFRLFDLLDLPNLNTCFYNLSSGQKRKFHLLLGLSNWTEYNIFDEALANIDPETSNLFLDQIIQLQKEFKGKIIFITHIPSEALFCERGLFILKENGEKIMKIISFERLKKINYYRNYKPNFFCLSASVFMAPDNYITEKEDIICDSELGCLEVIKYYYKYKTFPSQLLNLIRSK